MHAIVKRHCTAAGSLESSITPRLTETRHSVLGQQLGLVVHVRDEVVDVVAMRLHGAEVRLH